MTPNDIHNYDKKYKTQIRTIKDSDISSRNKELIFNFERAAQLEGISKPRRLKLLNALFAVVRVYTKKDLDKLTKNDIKSIVLTVDNREDYSPWTKQGYRVILKKFYKWLKFGDRYNEHREYPSTVSWINTNIKIKDQPKVRAADLLTEKEVRSLILSTEALRDRAFISLLYELGARIGEIGNLVVSSVTRDKYSFLVDLHGKTGRRTPRVVLSATYLAQWLNTHPTSEDPDAPLWPKRLGESLQPMQYGTLRMMVKRAAIRAGIQKRVYPHLFRHTRVTHLLRNRQISEAQAKVYFGWVPSSKMLSDYSHLVSSDVNDALLELYGIKKTRASGDPIRAKQCQACSAVNSEVARFCHGCGHVLDVKSAVSLDQEIDEAGTLVEKFLRRPDVKRQFKAMMVKELTKQEPRSHSSSE